VGPTPAFPTPSPGGPRITSPQIGLGARVRDTLETPLSSEGPTAAEPTTHGRAAVTTHALDGRKRADSPSLEPPTLERVATLPPPDEDDATFDDGGIREPLVPPTVSRAPIVTISDQPPPARQTSGGATLPRPAAMPAGAVPSLAVSTTAAPPSAPAPARPGTVPLVGAGDTPSTSAITQALEQMAREASDAISAPQPESTEERLSGFELDPQQLDSQIIRQILPTQTAPTEAPRRGEPTEAFPKLAAGRAAAPPTLAPRATTGDYVFFAVVAMLTIALGGISAVALLYADPGAALEVRSVPDVGATVLVDGAPRGRAPARVEALAPGRHTVTLVAHGYEEAHREVVLAARETASIEVALHALPAAFEEPPLPSGATPPEVGP
jgi:serine/threonine-protein kinase